MTTKTSKNILWWGRFDPDYSRNRIIRALLRESGYELHDFKPKISALGSLECLFSAIAKPDALWVPPFRQRDFHSAKRYAVKHNIPLIFDPLISAWDKVVFERKKYAAASRSARRILHWEQSMFSQADLLIADTTPHATFFIHKLLAPETQTCVIPVGAEESLFFPQPVCSHLTPQEILFFGSFIHLQGPEIIVKAAIQVPEARWTLLGDGPLRSSCEILAQGEDHIQFEEWLPYEKLPERIAKASLLLGIFGSSPKSGRVIPNKVYQALSCGRQLITRESKAYPDGLGTDMENGITFIPPGNPEALSAAVRQTLAHPELYADWSCRARQTYETWFSKPRIKEALVDALGKIGL